MSKTPLEAYAEAMEDKEVADNRLRGAASRAERMLYISSVGWITLRAKWLDGTPRVEMPTENDPYLLTVSDARELAHALLELVGDGKEPSDG